MTQVLVICVVAILIILMLRGINRPGIMLALMWAMYVIEQVILQNPFFLSRVLPGDRGESKWSARNV